VVLASFLTANLARRRFRGIAAFGLPPAEKVAQYTKRPGRVQARNL